MTGRNTVARQTCSSGSNEAAALRLDRLDAAVRILAIATRVLLGAMAVIVIMSRFSE